MASTTFFEVCVLSHFRSLKSSGRDEMHRNSLGFPSMYTDCPLMGGEMSTPLFCPPHWTEKWTQKEYKGRGVGHRSINREKLTLSDHH